MYGFEFFIGFLAGSGALGLVNAMLITAGKKPLALKFSNPELEQSNKDILESLESIKKDLESQQQTLHNLSQTLESIKDQTKPFEPPLPTQRW